MKGYSQIRVIYANKLYRRPANQYESDSSMTNKVRDTNVSSFNKVGNFSFIAFGHMKQLTPISLKLHFNALSSS